MSGYDKLYDVDWYDADKTNFELKTEEEFRGLSLVAFADNFKGKTITLKADMDLKDEAWLPIGPSGMAFAGTFDGGNHIIANMKFTRFAHSKEINGDKIFSAAKPLKK